MYQIDICVVLWINVRFFLIQKSVGPRSVEPKIVRLCVGVSCFYTIFLNNAKKWPNNGIIRLLIYIYLFRSFLKWSFQWWVLSLIYFSLGKYVAPNPSGNFSLSHTMACNGFNPTPFYLKHVFSPSAYFFYTTLCVLFLRYLKYGH